MRVKVTIGNGWYVDEVGNEYDVIRFQQEYGYIVYESENGSIDWIDVEDCIVLP